MKQSSARVMFVLLLGAAGCAAPPPSSALIVRHPEQKCGLIAFSDCRAYAAQSAVTNSDDDADAGRAQ